MGLATGTAKTLLFVFNFLFFVSGILIIVVGAMVLSQQKGLEEKVEFSTFSGAPIVLIVVGVFIMFISFFGCYGAISSSYCMLMMFASLLILIFILEFAAGIAAYVKKDSIVDSFKHGLTSLMKENYNETAHMPQKDKESDWDAIQDEWTCCGVNNYTDFSNTSAIPGTCCAISYKLFCDQNNATQWDAVKTREGCYAAMVDNIYNNIATIGGVGVGIAFIQILGITLACCLGMNVKNQL